MNSPCLPVKIHCSVLAEDAIKAAIGDLQEQEWIYCTEGRSRRCPLELMAELMQLGSEINAEAKEAEPKQVFVTPKAVDKIRAAFAREGVDGGLRLGVLGGGCSGLSYQFKFAPEPRSHDHVFHFEGVRVFVDPKSMVFLDGMTLDWQDSLIQSGFRLPKPACNKKLWLRHLPFPLKNPVNLGSESLPLRTWTRAQSLFQCPLFPGTTSTFLAFNASWN